MVTEITKRSRRFCVCFFLLFRLLNGFLYHIKQNAEVMEKGTGKDEDMPDGMHIPDFFHGVEDEAGGVGDASGQKEHQAGGFHTLDEGADSSDDTPAAGDVAYHGDDLEPFDADDIEDDAQDGHTPDNAEDGPADPSPQGDQCKGGIGSCNENEDGGMIEHTQDFFGPHVGNGVIHTGHGKEQNHAGSVNGGADNLPRVADAFDNQDNHTSNGQCRPQSMGDGVGDFLHNRIQTAGFSLIQCPHSHTTDPFR